MWGQGRAGRIETGDGLGSTLGLDALLESPLAAALALVVLACWGVLLVTRGRFRRVVAILGAVAALGLAATTALAPSRLLDDLRAALQTASGASEASVSLTGWYVAAVVGAAVSVVATLAAAVLVRNWPEMGSRYDAPTAAGKPVAADARPEDNLDMWKALDEGRDPTA